mgnify:CR=1 FL=1
MISASEWVITVLVLSGIIIFDLLVAIIRRNSETTVKESALWTIFYISLAILFGAMLPNWATTQAQGEFFATHGKIGLKSSALESVHGTNTVLHEILHAIVYQYGLVETLGDKEEIVVNTMANGLSTVFVDNPWLLDYIKKYQKVRQGD